MGHLHILAVVNNAAMNILLHFLVGHMLLLLFFYLIIEHLWDMLIFLLPSEIKILCTLPDSIPMVNQHAICNLYVDNMKGITYEQAFSLIWLKSCGFSWPCVLFRTLQLGCWLWLLTLASCWYRPEKAMVMAHIVRLVPPTLSLGFSSSSQLLLWPTLPNVAIWGVEPVEASTLCLCLSNK